MTTFEFQPEDFAKKGNHVSTFGRFNAAKIANAKIAPLLKRLQELEEMLENAPVVVKNYKNEWLEVPAMYVDGLDMTHKAKLVQIESIK